MHHIVDPAKFDLKQDLDPYYLFYDSEHGRSSSLHACANSNRLDLDPNLCAKFLFPLVVICYKVVSIKHYEDTETSEIGDFQVFDVFEGLLTTCRDSIHSKEKIQSL